MTGKLTAIVSNTYSNHFSCGVSIIWPALKNMDNSTETKVNPYFSSTQVTEMKLTNNPMEYSVIQFSLGIVAFRSGSQKTMEKMTASLMTTTRAKGRGGLSSSTVDDGDSSLDFFLSSAPPAPWANPCPSVPKM